MLARQEPNPFDNLKELVSSELEQVNAIILKLAESHAELIPTITHHLMSSGGKRLRPMLTLACANMFDCDNDHHIELAAAVEFIHTATLLHDDVIDESATRRGKETANNIWGNKPSILVGDYLLSQAFRLMVGSKSIEALDILSSTSAIISESEVWQLELINKTDLRLEDYIKLITGKTATLFAAACSVGGIVAGANKEQCDLLYDFGLNLGISFQIMDDILDYSSKDKKFGKKVGGDFKEGKVTLPILTAYNNANKEQKEFLTQVMQQGDKSEENFAKTLDIIEDCKAIPESTLVAKKYVEAGEENLVKLPDSVFKASLNEVLQHSLERLY